jgi:hypothetical protein
VLGEEKRNVQQWSTRVICNERYSDWGGISSKIIVSVSTFGLGFDGNSISVPVPSKSIGTKENDKIEDKIDNQNGDENANVSLNKTLHGTPTPQSNRAVKMRDFEEQYAGVEIKC